MHISLHHSQYLLCQRDRRTYQVISSRQPSSQSSQDPEVTGLILEAERTLEMEHSADLAVNGNSFLTADAQSSDHLKSFEEFFEHLNRAAKAVLPRSSRRYREVVVLLLRWQDDDLGTETEINDLEYIFRDIYHYRTERYLIPSSDSATQLEYRLNDFRRAYNHESSLLILYYGGHGSLDLNTQRPSRSI